MIVVLALEGTDDDGSVVMYGEVEEVIDMPFCPRVGDHIRAFDQTCEVYRVEWGRRHNREWGATVFVRSDDAGRTDA